jgi:hypothetical protein
VTESWQQPCQDMPVETTSDRPFFADCLVTKRHGVCSNYSTRTNQFGCTMCNRGKATRATHSLDSNMGYATALVLTILQLDCCSRKKHSLSSSCCEGIENGA